MQLDGTKFFYINQLEANPGMPTNAYGEEEYTPERIGWYDCACCPPNLARLMTSLGSYVWSSSEDTIYSHLFVGGTASFETAGGVKIALTSKYPWNGSVTYTVEPEQAGAEFTLAVRYPGWCHQMQVKVNGIPVSGTVKTDKGYWMIQRCRTDFADIQNKKECGGNRQWQNHYLRNWAANTKGKGII